MSEESGRAFAVGELERRLGRAPSPAEEYAWGTRFSDEVPVADLGAAQGLREQRRAGTWPSSTTSSAAPPTGK